MTLVTGAETDIKLGVIDAAMLALYADAWRRRWSKASLAETWGPIVRHHSRETVARVAVEITQTRKDKEPPKPAEFAEMLRSHAEIKAAREPEYPRRSERSEALVQEALAWARRAKGP